MSKFEVDRDPGDEHSRDEHEGDASPIATLDLEPIRKRFFLKSDRVYIDALIAVVEDMGAAPRVGTSRAGSV